MTTTSLSLPKDVWQLEFHSDVAARGAEPERPPLPPATLGYQVFAAGTTACFVGQRLTCDVLERTNERLAVAYADYPIPAIHPLTARLMSGASVEVAAEPFCPVGEPGERRDRANQFPPLRRRYDELLRDIPVWADRKLGISGEGGGAIPAVAGIDLELNIQRIYAFIVSQLRWLRGEQARASGVSDLGHIMDTAAQQEQRDNRQWILPLIFGGSGATGNACGQIMPYLIRHALRDMGIDNYQLWGVMLGPDAFKGLTPHVRTNYMAALHALDHMARRGFRREFINGLTLDMAVPPYDHLILIDDGTLPTDAHGRVTEAGMDEFITRAARAVRLLLTSDAWDKVSARTVNADASQPDDGKLRWITTLNAATCAVDKGTLVRQATAIKQAQLLNSLARRMSA